jgi:hypothetical protein
MNYVLDIAIFILLNMFFERFVWHKCCKCQKSAIHTEIEGLFACKSRISSCHGKYNYFTIFLNIVLHPYLIPINKIRDIFMIKISK